jgi:hypothetical protein
MDDVHAQVRGEMSGLKASLKRGHMKEAQGHRERLEQLLAEYPSELTGGLAKEFDRYKSLLGTRWVNTKVETAGTRPPLPDLGAFEGDLDEDFDDEDLDGDEDSDDEDDLGWDDDPILAEEVEYNGEPEDEDKEPGDYEPLSYDDYEDVLYDY